MRKKSVYDVIKKQNGEHFAQALRKFDSSLFEIDNLPYTLKYAGKDGEALLYFLAMLKNVTIQEVENPQNPFDLLKQAGYDAFLADTHQKQNSIEKYFAKGEELCTFSDYNRYQNYFIIHCIKKGAENLKREDFKSPDRQDEYATSVISIQILKRGGFIKICNRYNHTVEFADNTFNSNPDNIIMGLASALKHYFKVDYASTQEPLPEGYLYINNQIIEYDYEYNNAYFSKYYFVEDGKITPLNKDYQYMMDCFILDMREKRILNPMQECDSFCQVMQKEMQQKKHLHIRTLGVGNWDLLGEKDCLLQVRDNHIKKVFLPTTTIIPPCFMSYTTKVEEFHSPQVRLLGRRSFIKSPSLKSFICEKLQVMGEGCIGSSSLQHLCIAQIKKIGDACFYPYSPIRKLGRIEKLFLPFLQEMGWYCFAGYQIDELYLPSCKRIGNAFADVYTPIKRAYLPELEVMPKNSLVLSVEDIYAPKVGLVKKRSFLNHFRKYQKIKTNE